MSSIQQVAIASVCLVAAFAFGSYINQSQMDQSAQAVSDSPDNLRSLIEPEMAIAQVPGSKPQMRSKLSVRLPMPSIPKSNLSPQPRFGFGQQNLNSEEIPPPSDLTGRIQPTQNSLAKSFSFAPKKSELITNAPSFAPDVSGESSMPVVNKLNTGSSPILADSMRAPFQTKEFDRPAPMVKNAPVFAAVEANAQIVPADRSNQTTPVIGKAPVFPDFNRQSQPIIAAKPTLPDRRLSPLPSFGPAKQIAQQPTTIIDPSSSYETANREQFRYSTPPRDPRREQDNLMPIPSLNQSVTIDDPGGAFGNRDLRDQNSFDRNQQSRWSNSSKSVINHDNMNTEFAQQQQPQRRVARLPLRLNSNAESRLTRLRDNTIQKISLQTTQFSDYVVERGDSLQSIATDYFGKPDFYLDLYLANRDRLRYPGDLREGMSIKIPIYEQ